MKIKSSLKTAKTRDKNNQLVRRKGRLYVINKTNPRMKAFILGLVLLITYNLPFLLTSWLFLSLVFAVLRELLIFII